MKKFILGFIVGAMIFGVSSVYADDIKGLVGMKVGSIVPILIDGERFEHDGIIVDKRSYVPVRAAGELFGFDVDYQDGTVILNSPKEDEKLTTTVENVLKNDEPEVTVEGLRGQVEALIIRNQLLSIAISDWENMIGVNPDINYEEKVRELREELEENLTEIERLQAIIDSRTE